LTTEQIIMAIDPNLETITSIPSSWEDTVTRILLTVVFISLYTLIFIISLSFKTISRKQAIQEILKVEIDNHE